MDDTIQLEKCTDFTAVYMPSTENGNDPTKSGFKSKAEADSYIHENVCEGCGDLIATFLEWELRGVNPNNAQDKEFEEFEEDNPFADIEEQNEKWSELMEKYGDLYPSCAVEWEIIETDKYNDWVNSDEDFGGLMDRAGYKRA